MEPVSIVHVSLNFDVSVDPLVEVGPPELVGFAVIDNVLLGSKVPLGTKLTADVPSTVKVPGCELFRFDTVEGLTGSLKVMTKGPPGATGPLCTGVVCVTAKLGAGGALVVVVAPGAGALYPRAATPGEPLKRTKATIPTAANIRNVYESRTTFLFDEPAVLSEPNHAMT